QAENLVLGVMAFVKDEHVPIEKLTGVVGLVEVVSEVGDAERVLAELLLGFLVGAERATLLALFFVIHLLGAAEHSADFAVNSLAVFVNKLGAVVVRTALEFLEPVSEATVVAEVAHVLGGERFLRR